MTTNRNISLNYIKWGILPLFIILLNGCATPLSNYERTYTDKGKQIIARSKGIEVHLEKKKEYYNLKHLNGNYWIVYYVNSSKKPKCISTSWEIYDLVGDVPNGLTYVYSKSSVIVGHFRERKWKFDKLKVLVGGSGHVKNFIVIKPYKKRTDCLFPKGEVT